tara:strand:+ start:2625 stop:3773 length:1149 start_codon:yes stop_codon:yes gene_type:complete
MFQNNNVFISSIINNNMNDEVRGIDVRADSLFVRGIQRNLEKRTIEPTKIRIDNTTIHSPTPFKVIADGVETTTQDLHFARIKPYLVIPHSFLNRLTLDQNEVLIMPFSQFAFQFYDNFAEQENKNGTPFFGVNTFRGNFIKVRTVKINIYKDPFGREYVNDTLLDIYNFMLKKLNTQNDFIISLNISHSPHFQFHEPSSHLHLIPSVTNPQEEDFYIEAKVTHNHSKHKNRKRGTKINLKGHVYSHVRAFPDINLEVQRPTWQIKTIGNYFWKGFPRIRISFDDELQVHYGRVLTDGQGIYRPDGVLDGTFNQGVNDQLTDMQIGPIGIESKWPEGVTLRNLLENNIRPEAKLVLNYTGKPYQAPMELPSVFGQHLDFDLP